TLKTLDGSVGMTAVRNERRRLLAQGVRSPESAAETMPTLFEHGVAFLLQRKAILAPATHRGYASEYRWRIHKALGDFRLDELTRTHVEEWVAELARAATSRALIERPFRTLSAMLTAAVAWGHVERNVAKGVRLPAVTPVDEEAVRRVLDEAQLLTLYARG